MALAIETSSEHGRAGMIHNFPGDFEQQVLLAVWRLAEDAYGATVRDELETRSGRSVAQGAVYVTLMRLEKKGLLQSSAGESTAERGGRPRRYVRLTPHGKEMLARSRSALMALWDGLEGALDR